MKLARLLHRDPAAPTLRDRAAALREGLSRREAVLGVAVVTAPLPAVAAPVAGDHPDAALIALGQRWVEAYRVERAAAARWEAIPNASDLIATPDAVAFHPGDDALGIGRLATFLQDGRLWYCVGDRDCNPRYAHASALREPRRRRVTRPVRPEDNLPADAISVTTGEPWPEAQARADAIVAAWDWRTAEVARQNAASGHDEAEAAWNACDTALDAIEQEISAAKAHTLAGLTIKARLAQSLDDRHHRVSDDLLFEIVRGLVALNTPSA